MKFYQQRYQKAIFHEVQQQQSHLTNQQKIFYCIEKDQAVQICINRQCQSKCSYICCRNECLCQKQHKLCQRARIQTILEIIKQKIVSTQSIKTNLQNLINNAIDQISLLRDKLLIDVDKIIKYSNMGQLEKELLQITQKKIDQAQFNSKKLHDLWYVVKYNEANNKIDQTNQTFQKLIQECLIKSSIIIKQNFQKMSQFYKRYQQQKSYKSSYQLLKQIQSYRQLKKRIQIQFSQSNILSSEYIQDLINFFPNKIKHTTRIFKASDYQFDIKKYYELCGQHTDTLIICKTNKDKIIGGYTPLSFNPKQLSKYIPDTSLKSFLFSITNNEKFPIKNPQKAIFLVKQKNRISFGANEFDIGDKSNINNNCKTNLANECHYQKQNYSNEKLSYIKFNGNETSNFMVKQWEVWKLQFQIQKK